MRREYVDVRSPPIALRPGDGRAVPVAPARFGSWDLDPDANDGVRLPLSAVGARRLIRALPAGIRYLLDPKLRMNAAKTIHYPRSLDWLTRLVMVFGPLAYAASALEHHRPPGERSDVVLEHRNRPARAPLTSSARQLASVSRESAG